MILGVKIQNRKTKKFRGSGYKFNNIGKVWSRLRDAKLAVCPSYWYSFDNIREYKEELDSDFIIINDDGGIERMPVALYYIDFFERQMKHSYRVEKLQKILKEIRQYCKENNIELEE